MIPAIALILTAYCVPRLIISVIHLGATAGKNGRTMTVIASFIAILGVLGILLGFALVQASGVSTSDLPGLR